MVCQTWSSARLFALACLAGATAAGTAAAQTSLASQYDFRKFEYPDSALSTPLGINAKREVAGYYTDQAGVDHGYVSSKGKFTTIDYPGSSGTAVGGINDHGDLSGVYFDAKGFQHGFLLVRPAACQTDSTPACPGTFTALDDPDAVLNNTVNFEFGKGLGTVATGINRHRDVVGLYATRHLWSDAFLFSKGSYLSIDNPLASHTHGDAQRPSGSAILA